MARPALFDAAAGPVLPPDPLLVSGQVVAVRVQPAGTVQSWPRPPLDARSTHDGASGYRRALERLAIHTLDARFPRDGALGGLRPILPPTPVGVTAPVIAPVEGPETGGIPLHRRAWRRAPSRQAFPAARSRHVSPAAGADGQGAPWQAHHS